jgi:ankyrin repeat protein
MEEESTLKKHVLHRYGYILLHIFACNGKREIVKFLAEKGFDINAESNSGSSSLHIAVYNGYIDIVKYLLEKGADVNDKYGRTPIHMSIYTDQPEIIACLTESGVNVNVKDDWTPLNLAVYNTKLETVEFLARFIVYENLIILYKSKTLADGSHPLMVRISQLKAKKYFLTGLPCPASL